MDQRRGLGRSSSVASGYAPGLSSRRALWTLAVERDDHSRRGAMSGLPDRRRPPAGPPREASSRSRREVMSGSGDWRGRPTGLSVNRRTGWAVEPSSAPGPPRAVERRANRLGPPSPASAEPRSSSLRLTPYGRSPGSRLCRGWTMGRLGRRASGLTRDGRSARAMSGPPRSPTPAGGLVRETSGPSNAKAEGVETERCKLLCSERPCLPGLQVIWQYNTRAARISCTFS